MNETQISTDTIAAISTPPGRGGIGIVRLSGPEAASISAQLVRLRQPLEHARARLADVLDGTENGAETDNASGNIARIDEALVTWFAAPNSYTAEDVVEIAAHGSPVVLELLLKRALALGARLAEPGEFTQRAFLAGRLDLTQAEAVRDLIEAQTLTQVRQAARQMGGALSRRVAPAKHALVELIALLEAGIDFAEDDVDVTPQSEIARRIGELTPQLTALEASFARGRIVHDGLTLAIVGRPNAGKSSLFNRLLARDRAIVTPLPGTTRDTLEESLALGGIPLRLIDTAGLRPDGADEAEQHGIARTHEALADADLILLIHDATLPHSPEEIALTASLAGRPHLIVENKVDLLSITITGAPRLDSETSDEPPAIHTSALTGEGLDDLRSAILAQLGAAGSLAETGLLNNVRQQQSVAAALTALANAAAANAASLPHEMILLDLHTALRALDSLTGVTTADDILARIFSTFCIGK